MGDVFKSKRGRLERGIWGVKLLLVCVGIVSTVVFFKVAIIPYLLNFTLSTVPQIWISFRSCCLSPLYIYIILNFIIITIFVSSTFQNQKHHPSSFSPPSSTSITNVAKTPDIDHTHIQSHDSHNATALLSSSSDDHHSSNEISWHDLHMLEQPKQHEEEEQEESISMTLSTTSADASPEDAEDNTLDTTWKAIMEGQGKPMAKQLKKSETWDTPPRPHLVRSSNKLGEDDELDGPDGDDDNDDDAVSWARRELKKSDTFSDRVSLRRDKYMTQEELNQRAEAFITKFNNQMRLQRLQSDQRRFMDMLNRAH